MADLLDRFSRFHAANPHVYDELLKLSNQAYNRGVRRIGMRMLWEVMRWNLMIQTNTPDTWKLNDHYPPVYARLLMEDHPHLEGMFEVRKSDIDKELA